MLGSPCGPVHAAATRDMARQAYLMELHDSVHLQYTDGSLAYLGIASALDVSIPETILEQNYPHPFVGETTLEFSVVKLAHVRLDVIDVLAAASTQLWTGASVGTHTRCAGTANPCRAVCIS